MRIREYTVVKFGNTIISVKKDKSAYKATYSITVLTLDDCKCTKHTCKNRKEARNKMIRLLKFYTNLTMTEILKGLW